MINQSNPLLEKIVIMEGKWIIYIFVAVILGQTITKLWFDAKYHNSLQFNVHKMHDESGKVYYNISSYNWRKGQIARSKYLSNLTTEQVDSVRIVEERVNKKIK